ncbi:P-loop containing nucleoside triphosphate hydrolase protein [Mycena galopus ATCC 62051]|nr:P-loop containing nucleoside triphosphate hydrolase protein [Mycena galopus ATCC 62051]
MSSKVLIAARLRPKLAGEPPDDGGVRVLRGDPNSSACSFTGIAVTNPRDPNQIFRFPFTSCYDADATQEEIFNADVYPLIDVAWSGITVTIFAYGVTSSGKTHTMQGPPDDPGVIPRVVEALFAKAAAASSATGETEKTEITVSYIEIYKDDVYDLLVTRENAPKLPVRENESGMVFVAGLTSTRIGSVLSELDELVCTATARRSVGATLLNRASSRSHAVLTLEMKVRCCPSLVKVRQGKINLVDLAGSENNKLTGNDPSRMAESSAINKSLSVLGQVVHALNKGESRIPYRNAKLTRILQDALGGTSVGLLICNLSPALRFRSDTLNTLNFASRTKNIENKPVVNEKDVRPPPPPPKVEPVLAPAPKPVSTAPSRPGARPSLVPRPTGARVSSFGLPMANASASAAPSRAESRISVVEKEKIPPGLSEAEIDARIARAVEAEVARRLEEKERERELELEKEREKEKEAGSSKRTKSPKRSPKPKTRELPPGLSPLLKRHRDLDDELQARLAELERKFEKGNRDGGLVDALSPVSRKKTGRAYVALARSHSEQGNLKLALDLYRRAELYVPENIKLKERIIEVEWAVKNDKAFKPSPKRPKKTKKTKTKSMEAAVGMGAGAGGEERGWTWMLRRGLRARTQPQTRGSCRTTRWRWTRSSPRSPAAMRLGPSSRTRGASAASQMRGWRRRQSAQRGRSSAW